jgi:hypothetical protein
LPGPSWYGVQFSQIAQTILWKRDSKGSLFSPLSSCYVNVPGRFMTGWEKEGVRLDRSRM